MVPTLPQSLLVKILRGPGFWFILALLVLISIPHYIEALGHPNFLTGIISNINLSRHAFERILYLAPIVWAGFLFDWKGAFITSLAALAFMLPRVLFLSGSPMDAALESAAVFVIGNVLSISFASLRHERDHRMQLEAAHQELRISEERYRELFENAHDAIWLHDLEGNTITANRAAAELTGYSVDEMPRLNVKTFMSETSLKVARDVRRKLLDGELLEPYEQHIIRRDGTEAFVQLSTSLVIDKNGKPVAFQHIARDVTEQKRMQENLHFYLLQATRAQEEERKRISRELHDETIQALVVLSRRIDTLASEENGLSETDRSRLEELRERTNRIMMDIRRLSQDLRPAALDRLGLLPALQWLAEGVTQYSGVRTSVSVTGTERRFPEEVELVLFRITQEALRNVWRHSGATEAEVIVNFDQGRTSITIRDNGKGFSLPRNVGDLARDGKLGLAGMYERAQLIGASINVNSVTGKGSSITVELPT